MDGIVAAGGIAQPTPGRARPGPRRDELRAVQGRARPGRLPRGARARGVVMVEYPHGQVRAVTHYGVTAADIEHDHRRDPGGARRDGADRTGVRGRRTGRRHA